MNTAPKRIVTFAFIVFICMFIYFFAYPYVSKIYIVHDNKQTIALAPDLNPSGTIGLTINGIHLTALLADTEEKRETGLGGRGALTEADAMLFVFDTPDKYGFWMKDMSFPIDIAWLSPDFSINHIEANVSPSTYPNSFYPDEKSLYVIETNANYFADHNIKVGDLVSIDKN